MACKDNTPDRIIKEEGGKNRNEGLARRCIFVLRMTLPITPGQFSSYLFWDVNSMELGIEKSKKLIVHRVLELGTLEDWLLLKEAYGLDGILEVALELPNLEPRALSFVSTVCATPLEKFRCYTSKRSTKPHWPY